MSKTENYQWAFLDFYRNGTLHRAGVFVWGDPYDLGVVKSYRRWKNGHKKFHQKNLKHLTKRNRKMGGRSFSLTSGSFGDTLPSMC